MARENFIQIAKNCCWNQSCLVAFRAYYTVYGRCSICFSCSPTSIDQNLQSNFPQRKLCCISTPMMKHLRNLDWKVDLTPALLCISYEPWVKWKYMYLGAFQILYKCTFDIPIQILCHGNHGGAICVFQIHNTRIWMYSKYFISASWTP